MIKIEGTPGGVRIIGSLQGALLRNLLESMSGQAVVLDLSEVREADEAAIGVLARLPAARCRLVSCPRWLAFWIEEERRTGPRVGGP